jgi:hypothetical protein
LQQQQQQLQQQQQQQQAHLRLCLFHNLQMVPLRQGF